MLMRKGKQVKLLVSEKFHYAYTIKINTHKHTENERERGRIRVYIKVYECWLHFYDNYNGKLQALK